jgi:hypothetical protein
MVSKAATMPREAKEDIGANPGLLQEHPAAIICHGDIEQVTAEVDRRSKVVGRQRRRPVTTCDGRSP